MPVFKHPGHSLLQGHCVETVASDGFIAECFFTYVFEDGTLTANGPFIFDSESGVLPSVLAVTGGTGAYASYQGEVSYNHTLIVSLLSAMQNNLMSSSLVDTKRNVV